MRIGFSMVVLGAFASRTGSAAAAPIDDAACAWRLTSFRCAPNALCSYQPKFGDLTPSQSCRVRPFANKLPQQLHLAFAGEPAGSGMTVSWATFDVVGDSAVWVGTAPADLALRADVRVASASYYSEDKYTLYQHHATLTGLAPHTQYYYKVGSAANATLTSEISTFTTARASGDTTPFDMIVYGDLGDGDRGARTVEFVNALANDTAFVYHVGDISYADDDFLNPSQALGFYYEEVYNKWMNSLTPAMNRIPYMVAVGNHDAECHSPACLVSSYKKDRLGNYTAYNARFKMPSAESKGVKSMWYSFDYGSVHWTTVSSETDYEGAPSNAFTLTNKNGGFGNQLAWLEADLQKAAANRASVPWLIVGMHRPIYHLEEADRDGRPKSYSKTLQVAMEELFLQYGVDVVVSGHRHSYERQLPIARNEPVLDGVSSDRTRYENPKAPVYLITGGAGNVEANNLVKGTTARWHVLQTSTYGVNTVRVTPTEMVWKYVDSETQRVVDELTITKSA